jgi:toxin YhaV
MSHPAAPAGWSVIAHPLFAEQLEALVADVAALKAKDPNAYQQKNATKRLGAIVKLAFEEIPNDPTLPIYRQGDTLGEEYKHWFRAKFFQQYRLFFRYHLSAKVIVIAWVNDTDTKRAYGSKTDAYRTFRKMLNEGHPPDTWEALVAEASAATERMEEVLKAVESVMPGSGPAG